MDRFPEAFQRFEKVVDLRSFRSPRELTYAFIHWAGRRWINSRLQNRALKIELEKRGFTEYLPRYTRPRYTRPHFYTKQTWKREIVRVKGKPQVRYRDAKTGRFIKKP